MGPFAMQSHPSPQTSLSRLRIAIIGAGIAGLTAAILLAQKGATVAIFEKAKVLDEVGAGIQISPNAAKILAQIGLLERLKNSACEPDHIALCDGQSLRKITHVPVKKLSETTWRAPYMLLARADLQKALLDRLETLENITLHLDQSLDFSSKKSLLSGLSEAAAINGQGQMFDLVIGADGVHSKTRDLIAGSGQKQTTDYVAWRLLIDHDDLANHCPDIAHTNDVHVLMSAIAHLALYPKSISDKVRKSVHNLVFVTHSQFGQDLSALITQLDLHAGVKTCLQSADNGGLWPLYEISRGNWHDAGADDGPPIVLIGDAAHAIPPFLAQGAAMAIEDCALLCQEFSCLNYNMKISLQYYELKRKNRIQKVKKRTEFNRFSYHARGPIKIARNMVMAIKSPQSLGRDLDWLYGWQVDDNR